MPKSTNEIVQGRQIIGAAMGKPKAGKTVNLCTFPGKIFVFDIDKRINSVKLMHPERTNIHYEQYEPDGYEQFESDVNKYCQDGTYGMYILDSLTSLSDLVINYSMRLRGTGDRSRDGKTKGIIRLTEIEDFGAEAAGLQKIILALANIKHAHVFITMHVLKTTAFDISTQKEIVMSQVLTGGKKIAAKIPTLFNEIWAFDSIPGIGVGADSSYVMYTTPTLDVPSAGTTLPLPKKIDCTLPKNKLWEQIEKVLVPVTPLSFAPTTAITPK